jgi:hypothetical protein
MATPHVSGIAAMVWAQDLKQTNTQVRTSIETSAEEFGALGQKFEAWVEHGRVNLYEALMLYDSGSSPSEEGVDGTPPVMSNVTSANLKGNSFEITWTTDEPADTLVTFVCCNDVRDDALVTSHRLTFRGNKNVGYDYYVTSTNAAGLSTMAGPFYHQN